MPALHSMRFCAACGNLMGAKGKAACRVCPTCGRMAEDEPGVVWSNDTLAGAAVRPPAVLPPGLVALLVRDHTVPRGLMRCPRCAEESRLHVWSGGCLPACVACAAAPTAAASPP